MANFDIQVFQNEFLAAQATDVYAVASVTCSNAGSIAQSGPQGAAELVVIDASGSICQT